MSLVYYDYKTCNRPEYNILAKNKNIHDEYFQAYSNPPPNSLHVVQVCYPFILNNKLLLS
jgi:hypothetical protein